MLLKRKNIMVQELIMKGCIWLIKRKNGFTLIEMMIVTAVVAILAATAVPALNSWVPNYRLKKAAMDLQSNFQKAKMTAIKRNCNCTINFNQVVGGTNFDYVVFVDIDSDLVYGGDLTVDGLDNDNDGAIDDADEIETILSTIRLTDYRDVRFDTNQGADNDGIGFLDNGFGNKSLSFMPNGFSTDTTGVLAGGTAFLINTNNRTRRVIVSNSGSVKIQD